MGKSKEKTQATQLECGQCEATAIGLASHVGKLHQRCGDKVFVEPTESKEGHYKIINRRVKGDGSPRAGCGKWARA